jgi:mono/diheme cytochrome c family protein
MSRFLRILVRAVLVVFALILVGVAVLYALSARALSRTYPVPSTSVPIPADSASLARGAHLFESVGSCVICHEADGGGKVVAEMGPIGTAVGSNLTRGTGGVGSAMSDADWVSAIRYGVRRDGTSLMLMPSQAFTNMSDEDLGALIAWVKQLPPVDREIPRSHFKLLGRILLGAGRLPMLTAPNTRHAPTGSAVPAEATAPYGKYLVEIAGCRGCHGPNLSGADVGGPPGVPPASNLTPGGLVNWTQDDFRRAIREGKRPDGTVLNEFMPWEAYAKLTDLEVEAIWLYLRSVPALAFGGE